MKRKHDIPEWSLPYTDNYTGMYWSDGKFQASVKGKKEPRTKLDRLSKTHDESYFDCSDDTCLDNADFLYYQDSREMSFWPRLIGSMPLANIPVRKIATAVGYPTQFRRKVKNMKNVFSNTDPNSWFYSPLFAREQQKRREKEKEAKRLETIQEEFDDRRVYAPVVQNDFKTSPVMLPVIQEESSGPSPVCYTSDGTMPNLGSIPEGEDYVNGGETQNKNNLYSFLRKRLKRKIYIA